MKQHLSPVPAITSAPRRQRGVAAVEFALGSFVFFAMVFGLIELARAFYLWNTMVEVTWRASRSAAITGFLPAEQEALRHKAIFGELNGGLPLGGGLNKNNLVVDYLNNDMGVVPAPACPEQNLVACAADPTGSGCIRFVRARLCTSAGGGCERVQYVPMVGGMVFPGGALAFPTFAAVTPVASLGLVPGTPSSCP